MKMSPKEFINYVKTKISDPAKTYLLALSGGIDSCVLFDVFIKLGIRFEVAHVNFGLRGLDSNLDEEFVRDLCKKNNIILHCKKVTENDLILKKNTQIWARNLRYTYFNEIKCNHKLDVLTTAHHADDALETFILNLSKASGLRGLCGISSDINKVFRPLLDISKNEILEFASLENVKFREDITNQKTDYTRNFIRHKISPKFDELNKDFIKNFTKSISYLNESQIFIENQVEQIISEIKINNKNFLVLDRSKLFEKTGFIVYEILKKFGFHNRFEQEKIKNSQSGSVFYSNTHQLHINRKELIIKELLKIQDNIDESIIKIDLPFIDHQKLKIEIFESTIFFEEIQKENHWKIDYNKVNLPLLIRKKQEGDFFFPKGMLGSKKISKYFKDEKLSQFEKESINLLCDSSNNILGVLEKRQDSRYLIDAKSEKIIIVKFIKKTSN